MKWRRNEEMGNGGMGVEGGSDEGGHPPVWDFLPCFLSLSVSVCVSLSSVPHQLLLFDALLFGPPLPFLFVSFNSFSLCFLGFGLLLSDFVALFMLY